MKANFDSVGTRRARRRFSPEQVQAYLAAFARQGVSAAVFAREQQLCYSAFLRWRKLPASRSGPGTHRFREVPLGAVLGSARWAAEIVRPDGLTVRVSAEVSSTWLQQVLRAC